MTPCQSAQHKGRALHPCGGREDSLRQPLWIFFFFTRSAMLGVGSAVAPPPPFPPLGKEGGVWKAAIARENTAVTARVTQQTL